MPTPGKRTRIEPTSRSQSKQKRSALVAPTFIEPMLLLKTSKLPEGEEWLYEIKLDGFRALATKSGGEIIFRYRNDKDFGGKFGSIVEALARMTDETVIDGELVALDEEGRPSFNLLQNYRSSMAPLVYYAFDLLMLNGKNLMDQALIKRRKLLEKKVLSKLKEPIRFSPVLDAALPDLIRSVKEQGLEGLVAKRKDSKYEPGLRSGVWQKMRINAGQELVIGGYTPSAKNFDARWGGPLG